MKEKKKNERERNEKIEEENVVVEVWRKEEKRISKEEERE